MEPTSNNVVKTATRSLSWAGKFIIRLRMLFVAWGLLLTVSASADYVIHIQNPWRDSVERKDTLWMLGNYVVGYYPGVKMKPEGDNWFYYVYTTPLDKNQSHGFQVVSYIPTIYSATDAKLTFPAAKTLSIDSLFSQFPAGTTEIWIYVDSTAKKNSTVLDHPKNGKVIHLFNPWPDNSCQIIIQKRSPMHMYMRQDLCGWYTYYYGGPLDSLTSVQFTDYYHKDRYTSLGLVKTGDPLNLAVELTFQDTVYILPQPFPIGPPIMTSVFPGKTGECGSRKISAVFRDWKLDDASFFNDPTGKKDGGSKNMVQKQLTGPDYKPKKTTDASVNTKWADSLNTWFVTKTFGNGTNNDTCIDLMLVKGDDGRWTFDSDKMGGFFPLDNFNDSNNIKYYDRIDPKDPTGKMRNFHFTMEMHLQFIYHQGAGLEFYFRGDDDVWIFVNNNLAIDLGGLHEKASDTLLLDQDKTKLGLTDGQSYNMDIFYCERNPVASNLLIKTSMDLHNSNDLYYKEKALKAGTIQYDIWQRLKVEGPDCGFTPLLNAETLATVIFYLDGPEYILKELNPGTHFGGIVVDANKSRVTVDSTKIDSLVPGDYKITFKSTFDTARTGYLIFTVPPFPPDHLDIVSPTAVLSKDRDQPADTIFLDIDLDETTAYAVSRDKNG
jgi:fibro-slime domain-containing protein